MNVVLLMEDGFPVNQIERASNSAEWQIGKILATAAFKASTFQRNIQTIWSANSNNLNNLIAQAGRVGFRN